MLEFIVKIGYLIGAVAFVWGLKRLSSPDTARQGNRLAAIGMGIAIVVTLIKPIEGASNNYIWIVVAMVIGSIIGWISSKKIEMTSMPQMVSIFNGLGGACATILAWIELGGSSLDSGGLFIVLFTLFVGAVSFTGSLLAFAKLQGLIYDQTLLLPKHNVLNILLLIACIAVGVLLFINPSEPVWIGYLFLILSLVYGFSFVIPIGGADMPVVISLLNSLTGLSAAAAGLIYNNNIMLVGGILVGASGTILTVLMCQAMNRPLIGVLLGGFGGGASQGKAGADGQVAKEVGLTDAAIQLYYSKQVVIVPGYGLAVAQAQKVCKELDDILSSNGVDVKYAIHPVAGRMPGHMNVLLAEADVPYPKLIDLDDANDLLPNTDVTIIVGANDVVNPAAKDDPGSPIYGMPVLNVWESKNVIVLKRSMSPGYAGIQNPLFFMDNNKMLFGDAKDTLTKLVSEVKAL